MLWLIEFLWYSNRFVSQGSEGRHEDHEGRKKTKRQDTESLNYKVQLAAIVMVKAN